MKCLWEDDVDRVPACIKCAKHERMYTGSPARTFLFGASPQSLSRKDPWVTWSEGGGKPGEVPEWVDRSSQVPSDLVLEWGHRRLGLQLKTAARLGSVEVILPWLASRSIRLYLHVDSVPSSTVEHSSTYARQTCLTNENCGTSLTRVTRSGYSNMLSTMLEMHASNPPAAHKDITINMRGKQST